MRILWIKTELLHPVDKGGRIRTYEMLRRLKERHEVTYVCLVPPGQPKDSFERAYEYCDQLVTVPWRAPDKYTLKFSWALAANFASSLPYALEKYRSELMRHEIRRLLRERHHDIVVCDFLAPAPNVAEGLDVPTALFQHNVEALIWRRHYENARSTAKRAYFWYQWQKMLRYERAQCRRFDTVVAVSDCDAALFRDEYGAEHVMCVPTGVDHEYFQPTQAAPRLEHLVFTGSMDWLPNEDAVLYFAREILPRIHAEVPGASLTVVGRNPSPPLVDLERENAHVHLTGRVDDIRPYVQEASVYVVPLRIGGGTRLKIFEAMAMEKAVVSTSVGAEGLPVVHGKDLIIEDDPERFARSVVDLLRDRNAAQAMGQRARALVETRFGWENAAAALSRQLDHVSRKKAPAPAQPLGQTAVRKYMRRSV